MSSKRTGLWRSTRTLGLVLGFASVALVWNPEVAQAQNVNSGVKASISDGGVQLWFLADRFGDVDPDGGPCPDPREIGATNPPCFWHTEFHGGGLSGQVVTRTDYRMNERGEGVGGGRLTYTFNLEAAGQFLGEDFPAGTYYLWARAINPFNTSDFLIVEGHDAGFCDPSVTPNPNFPNLHGCSISGEICGSDGWCVDLPDTADPDTGLWPRTQSNFGDRVFEHNIPSDPDALDACRADPDACEFEWATEGYPLPAGLLEREGHDKMLQAGQNTMHFYHRQGGSSLKLDVVMWTNDPDYVPTDGDYLSALSLPACVMQKNGCGN